MNVFLRYSQGQLFEQSKEQKEGYESFKKLDGTLSNNFRKYHTSIVGKFDGVRAKDSKFGKVYTFFFKGETDTYWVDFNLLSEKGGMNISLMEFCHNLKGMTLGEEYRLWPYFMEKDENNKRDKHGISVSKVMPSGDFDKLTTKNGGKYTSSFKNRETGEVDQGDIPLINFSKSALGAWTIDQTKAEEFLFEKLNLFVRSSGKSQNEPEEAYEEPTAPVAPIEPNVTKEKKKNPF